ncbi:hypothetical protein SBA2_460004 [Acidobacteriia bacterium SbA2]|nr:hypothetical protein SBA2_460004 [Acidobacteriia bacterium SbA2]
MGRGGTAITIFPAVVGWVEGPALPIPPVASCHLGTDATRARVPVPLSAVGYRMGDGQQAQD